MQSLSTQVSQSLRNGTKGHLPNGCRSCAPLGPCPVVINTAPRQDMQSHSSPRAQDPAGWLCPPYHCTHPCNTPTQPLWPQFLIKNRDGNTEGPSKESSSPLDSGDGHHRLGTSRCSKILRHSGEVSLGLGSLATPFTPSRKSDRIQGQNQTKSGCPQKVLREQIPSGQRWDRWKGTVINERWGPSVKSPTLAAPTPHAVDPLNS